MSPKKLRLLAECIEQGPIREDDRRAWANDLRGQAKSLERSMAEDAEEERQAGKTEVG